MEPHPVLADLAGRLQLAPMRSRWSGAIDGVAVEMKALEDGSSGAVVKLALGKGSPHGWRADPAQARPDLPHPGLVAAETGYQTGVLTLQNTERMGGETAEAWVRAFVKHALDSGWMKEDGACCICGKEGRMVSAGDPVLLCGECLPQVRKKKAELELRGPGTWSAGRSLVLVTLAVAAGWTAFFVGWDFLIYKMSTSSVSLPGKLWIIVGALAGAPVGFLAAWIGRKSSFGGTRWRRWIWMTFAVAGCVMGEALRHQVGVWIAADMINPLDVLRLFGEFLGGYGVGDWLLVIGVFGGALIVLWCRLPCPELSHSTAAQQWLAERRAEEGKAKAAARGFMLTGVQVMK